MTNRRIFMYATQTKLVEEESFLFHKLGFDVYTAAWATNQTTHFLGYREFHPNHFYQGSCDFLSEADVKILSKIDVDWGKLPRIPVDYRSDVCKTLLDNFDIMYVTAPTPWLLYAEDFLKAGKIVIYRSFGYAPYTWGKFVDLDTLFKYDKFHVVTCVPLDQKQYPRSFTAVTMLNKELIEPVTEAPNKYAFTVFPGANQSVVNSIMEGMKTIQVPWVLHDYCKIPWMPHNDINKLFGGCFLFVDLNSNVRYPALEAILHGKVSLIKNGLMLSYMKDTGIDTTHNFWYADYANDLKNTVSNVYSNTSLRSNIIDVQREWLERILNSAVLVWKEVLEVSNDN